MKSLANSGPILGLLLILYTFFDLPNTFNKLSGSPYLSSFIGPGNGSIITASIFMIIAVLVIIGSVGTLFAKYSLVENLAGKKEIEKQAKAILPVGLLGMLIIELLIGNTLLMSGYLLSLILVAKMPR